jgi:hypothetical protein
LDISKNVQNRLLKNSFGKVLLLRNCNVFLWFHLLLVLEKIGRKNINSVTNLEKYHPNIYMDELLNAFENQSNASIVELNSDKIKKHKDSILEELMLPMSKKKKFLKKLENYRYCTDLKDIQFGFYIRWIPLRDPEHLSLTNGGVICDIKIVNDQLQILCKNAGRFFQIKFDENVIFQKISNQERVILAALDYLG